MDEQERPVEVERETTVIQTGNGGSGGLLAILVLLVLAVGAFLFFGGYLDRAADEVGVNVNIDAPDVKMPDINIDTGKGESRPAEAPANSN